MTKFNENEYKRDWKKENMKTVRASFKILGITQADAIREAMNITIQKADEIRKK